MTRTVAVNEAILTRGISGSARVTQQMITAIIGMPDVQSSGVRPRRPRASSKVLNAARDAQWDLVGASRAAGPVDLLLSPCNIGKAWGRQRHLLMVYDVMVWEAREHFDPAFGAYARMLIPPSMRQADMVLTISQHARDVLSSFAPRVPIRVVHPPATPTDGPNAIFPQRPTAIVLGETAPHKNQVTAVEAVADLRRRSGVDVRLRVIGPPGRAEQPVVAALQKADPSGEWTSREQGLSQGELDTAMAQGWVLIQPSLHEGYGLPLIEAADRGLPVVHSGRGGMMDILPECSVDSTSTSAFSARLEQLLDREEWELTSHGVLERATRFTRSSFEDSIRAAVDDLTG